MKIKIIILSTMSVIAMSAFAGEPVPGKDFPPPPVAQKLSKEGFKPHKNQPPEQFAREERPEFKGHYRMSKEEKLEGVIKELLVVNALQSKIIMDLVQLDKPLPPPPGFAKDFPHNPEGMSQEVEGRPNFPVPPLPKE